MRKFLVGGAVRDMLMGIPCNDLDYTVEAESFDAMRQELLDDGYKIFVESPQFLTIRAIKDRKVADFVLARREGDYTDGRRPDFVEPGDIYDDLARRDFTINAIAIDHETGRLIDPHNGQMDIRQQVIRAVGDPVVRIQEDALRILRAIRFSVTKDFVIESDLIRAIDDNAHLLSSVSSERIREELEKMFKHDTIDSMRVLNEFFLVRDIVFSRGIRLIPSMKK